MHPSVGKPSTIDLTNNVVCTVSTFETKKYCPLAHRPLLLQRFGSFVRKKKDEGPDRPQDGACCCFVHAEAVLMNEIKSVWRPQKIHCHPYNLMTDRTACCFVRIKSLPVGRHKRKCLSAKQRNVNWLQQVSPCKISEISWPCKQRTNTVGVLIFNSSTFEAQILHTTLWRESSPVTEGISIFIPKSDRSVVVREIAAGFLLFWDSHDTHTHTHTHTYTYTHIHTHTHTHTYTYTYTHTHIHIHTYTHTHIHTHTHMYVQSMQL